MGVVRHIAAIAVRWCVLSLVGAVLGSQVAAAEVTVEHSEKGAVVKIDGQLFAEYLTCVGHQPAVWPIIGPTGKPMTRSYPAGPLLAGETPDHPHHPSLWFAHGNVNGHDFWTNHAESHQDSEIRHRGFVKLQSGDAATIVTRNDWLAEGKTVCEDERTLTFGADRFGRYVDFRIALTASAGDVAFGDTKEGTFGVRASGPLTVDSKQGAVLVDDRGLKNENAWGLFGNWIDDYGPVDDEVLGIALFSHPANFCHPTRWHARTYGLLAANPFGETEFPSDASQPKQGPYTLRHGATLSLRYRIVLHRGSPQEAKIDQAYQDFASRGP